MFKVWSEKVRRNATSKYNLLTVWRQSFATNLCCLLQVCQDVDPWLSIKQRPCVLKAQRKAAKIAKAVAKAAQLAARPKAKAQRNLLALWDLA